MKPRRKALPLVLASHVGRKLGQQVLSYGARKLQSSIREHFKTTKKRSRPSKKTSVRKRLKQMKSGERDLGRKSARSGYSKRISGGKKIKSYDRYLVSKKIEKGVNFLAYNAIYAGGWTHPAQQTIGLIAQALIRFFAIKLNIDFASFEEDFLLPQNSLQNFSIDFWWRNEDPSQQALQVTQVLSTGIFTWSVFAGFLVQKFLEVFGIANKTVDKVEPAKRLIYIGLRGQGVAPVIGSQLYKADELFVTVNGVSNIQVQNRTPGVDPTVPGELIDQTDSIFANPLRGQYYTFNNGRPVIKSPGTVSATEYSLVPADAATGTITAWDERGTIPFKLFDQTVVSALKKPPPGRMFTNCKTSKTMQIDPGQIAISKAKASVTKSLSSWMYLLSEKMRAVSTKTYVGLAFDSDPISYRVGVSHMYGLEKMCDTEAGSVVGPRVGIEHNLYMSAKVVHKRKQGILPQIDIQTP